VQADAAQKVVGKSSSSASTPGGIPQALALPDSADAAGLARVSNARIVEWSDGKTYTLQVGSRHYALPLIPTSGRDDDGDSGSGSRVLG